jgi:4-hydroxybenzoate polyprenyltransferase
LRLHQWTKNLLVFAALIFSQNLGHGDMVGRTVLAFLAFCFLSSSVYIINDILDAERDRAHPVKRFRPIASGKLKPGIAFFGAILLLALAGLIAWRLDGGPPFLKVLGGYFLLNLAYSLFLKKMVVADVIIIAFGFLLRVAAGGLIISVALSHWLIMCTFFVATMLACCKRRAELASAGDSKEARAVLADYSLPLLDLFITMSASATLMAYALYTVSDRTIAVFHTTHLIYTVPLVMYGMGRYLFLVYRKNVGEDPAATLIKDPGLIIAVLLWLAMTYILLYGAQ